MLSLAVGFGAACSPATSMVSQSRVVARASAAQMVDPVVVGVAADSGCGKSTFMRRLTSIFGGESKLLDIGRETNTLVSDMTTVICLDDYHKWDRTGRKSNPEWPDGITALHEACQDWDKMAADVTDLKAGKTVSKPIYNHITGELDPYEEVSPTPIVIFEGLHPMVDERVNAALDLSVYLDITDDVKFAWKAQRDIAERGATMEEVQAAIDGRKPDFAAYVEPQKAKADIIVQVGCRTARLRAPPAVRPDQGNRPTAPTPPPDRPHQTRHNKQDDDVDDHASRTPPRAAPSPSWRHPRLPAPCGTASRHRPAARAPIPLPLLPLPRLTRSSSPTSSTIRPASTSR